MSAGTETNTPAAPAEIPAYCLVTKNRFVLVGHRHALNEYYGGQGHLAVFRARENADRALHLAYLNARHGEQFGIETVERFILVKTSSEYDSLKLAISQGREMAEFTKQEDAEAVRDAMNAAHKPVQTVKASFENALKATIKAAAAQDAFEAGRAAAQKIAAAELNADWKAYYSTEGERGF